MVCAADSQGIFWRSLVSEHKGNVSWDQTLRAHSEDTGHPVTLPPGHSMVNRSLQSFAVMVQCRSLHQLVNTWRGPSSRQNGNSLGLLKGQSWNSTICPWSWPGTRVV